MNKNTAKLVAKTILEHPLAEHLKNHSKDELESICNGIVCHNMYIEFQKMIDLPSSIELAHVSCELSVREIVCECISDEEGNVLNRLEIQVGVLWPSYGAAEYRVTQSRLKFMSEITELARLLAEDICKPVTEIMLTAEHVKEKEIAQKELNNRLLAERIITSLECKPGLKNMRVGNTRTVRHDLCVDLDEGTWRVSLSNKQFNVTKSESTYYVFVTRVANEPL